MSAYYNEHDPFAAAWLRELIKVGLIADGEVDERDIQTVTADDVRGFVQCHFFAGIGGWSYALRLAGWDDARPVWTGSCPCQPFSAAGTQAGGADSRHLWPHWARLIRECRPPVVVGEQVESAIAHGWLDLVCDDLEREAYAVGSVGLPAASVGAPHIRQLLWFVAESDGWHQSQKRASDEPRRQQSEGRRPEERAWVGAASRDGLVADDTGGGQRIDGGASGRAGHADERGEIGELADPNRGRQRERGERHLDATQPAQPASQWDDASGRGELGDTNHTGPQRRDRAELPERPDQQSPWATSELIACRDGKARPVEPSIFPLASGIQNRVGLLRGAGNSIVPQVAAEVIRAYMELQP